MIKYIRICDKCGLTVTTDNKFDDGGITCYDGNHYLCDRCRTKLQKMIYDFLSNKEFGKNENPN